MDTATFIELKILPSILLATMLMLCGFVLHLVRTSLKADWEPLRYFLVADVALSAVSVLLQQRNLATIYGMNVVDAVSDAGQSVLASRAVTLALMIACTERIIRFVLTREFRTAKGLPLLLGAMLFLVVINLVSPLLGKYPDFEHKYIYAPILMLALFAQAQSGWEDMVRIARNGYVLFLGVGLLFLAVQPNLVMDFRYPDSLVPGFDVRFYGFATHANTVSPYCLLLLCVLWLCPFERRSLNLLAVAIALVALVLSQSKTTIAITAIIFALLWARRQFAQLRKRPGAHLQQFKRRAAVGLSVAVAGVCSVVLLALLTGTLDNRTIENIATDEGLLTLTGRTVIWDASLRWLGDNVFFGYGADLWGLDFQQRVGMRISHAHNQYIHTLGDSGLSGLLVLVAYLVVLTYYSWLVRGPTQWVSVMLVGSIIFRGITEAPMITDSVYGVEFALQVTLFLLCIGSMKSLRAVPSVAQAADPADGAPLVAQGLPRPRATPSLARAGEP